ncbi:MAG: PEP-CTERM sorting domain-containing protein [Pseudomonadota bacterium]
MMYREIGRCLALVAAFTVFYCAMAIAQDQGSFGKVIRIERDGFSPDAGLITFSEFNVGQRNPFYASAKYGGDADGVSVTFSGFFAGQNLASRGQCPRGANPQGCVTGIPASPLQMDARSPTTFIASDNANPTSPSLSGSPKFNGPVSILFDRDIAGVGLAGGYFNAERSTAITVFARDGRKIGGVVNLNKGMEYMALVTEDGSNRIAGLQFSLVGPEPAGYAIDELSFAFAGQINREQVPRLSDALETLVSPDAGTPPQNKTGGLSGLFEDDAADQVEAPDAPAVRPAPNAAGGLTDLFKSD